MWKKIRVFTIVAFILYLILYPVKYHYFDIYLLSLNGQVEHIQVNTKERSHAVVSGVDHDFGHDWPKFQKYVEVGDSVYKEPKKYDIILVKKETRERIVCTYE